MFKEQISFKEDNQSLSDNIALLERAKKLKERALKIIKEEGVNNNESTKS